VIEFCFENLGYVDKGKLKLADLTVICGENNVGKTYVSYAVYGFLKHFKQLIKFEVSDVDIEELKNSGSIQVDLMQYIDNLPHYFEQAGERFTQGLYRYFNVSDDFFEKTKLKLLVSALSIDVDEPFKGIINFGQVEKLRFEKAPHSKQLVIALQLKGKSRIPTEILEDVISETIADYLFSDILPKPFVMTSERTGISLFYTELDTNRNALVNHLTDTDKIDPIKLLNSMRSRYAKPIQDNIDVIRDYDNLNKQKSFIRQDRKKYKGILDSLQALLGGSFKNTGKQINYHPRKERGRDRVAVPVYIASSSIKSLFLLDYYINCLAEEKGILIIDEPELNLHPNNQRKMANLIARLVNAGVKVLITTHSDYLVRELNNRIMLSNDVIDKEILMQNESLIFEDILKPEQVAAYVMTKKHILEAVPVDEYGINMKLFDNLITEANKLADDIYYNIKD